MRLLIVLIALFLGASTATCDVVAAQKPNLLIITVDDMSADSLGVFGCQLPDTSPNIDALAAQGMRFTRAHVVVGNCFPSRNVMWSGLYPHTSGVEGFYQVPGAKYPHLADLMQGGGYFTGIQHKVAHSTPYSPYPAWDVNLDDAPDGKKRDVKAAQSYFDGLTQGIQAAKQAGKPFCMLMNVADPHKPFYAEGKGGATVPDENVPSRVFTPDEVPIPGFLFDDPVVRKELSHYYSSVRRADDCVGAVLAALDASGERDNTIILFLSDHGMPLPFAKTQVYHHSSRTPLFFIVPGMTKAGAIDSMHMVSAVDLLPTLLELTGIEHPGRMDGRSFAPLLRGEQQADRDFVIKEYNENSGASRDPMRSLQTNRYLYIFNPWSNGERVFATATSGTSTYRRMAELAKTDPEIAARHDLYQHRVPEELYDIENDPDCLSNLIDSPEHQAELGKLRSRLQRWMVGTQDGMLSVFLQREDAAARESYVRAQERQAEARRASKNTKAKKNAQPAKDASTNAAKKKQANMISLKLPESIQAGRPLLLKIEHDLPSRLGAQTLTVTLKGGTDGKRIDRKTVTASGKGIAEVTFELPAIVTDQQVSLAVFVGADYSTSLQHIQSNSLPVH